MKKKITIKTSTVVFAALILLFIAFSIFMPTADDNETDSVRNESPYYKVADVAVTEIEDSSAPLGMRRQYIFSLDNIDAGDKLITDFADILRKNIGSSEALFRWGGDEFIILVRNANSQKLADYASKIKKATEEHNNLGNMPNIHFACGYALSDDFPTLSKRELLAKADELMYEEKNRWHAKYMKK